MCSHLGIRKATLLRIEQELLLTNVTAMVLVLIEQKNRIEKNANYVTASYFLATFVMLNKSWSPYVKEELISLY